MKNIKNLLVGLMACSLLFAACNKDDEEKNDTPTKQNAVTLNTNQLLIGNQVYDIECIAEEFNGGIQYTCSDPNGGRFIINGGIYTQAYNKTFNLNTHNDGFHFGFDFNSNVDNFCSFEQIIYDNHEGGVHGMINNEEYDNSSIFKSGNATTSYDENGLTITLRGVLQNDVEFGFKMRVASGDIERE